MLTMETRQPCQRPYLLHDQKLESQQSQQGPRMQLHEQLFALTGPCSSLTIKSDDSREQG